MLSVVALMLTLAGCVASAGLAQTAPGVPPSYSLPPGPSSPQQHWDIREDMSAGQGSGTVVMRLTIGVDGRVTDCVVTQSSGKPGLDRSACSGMMRMAHFKPAIDDNGAPIVSQKIQTVRFDLH